MLGSRWDYNLQGATARIIGSSLWTLGMDVSVEGNLEERANFLQGRIFHHYSAQGVPHQERIKKLTWSMICSSRDMANPAHYPDFHGCKAAHTRHLVGPVRAVAEELNTDGRLDHLVEVLRNLERFYSIMDSYGHFIPAESARDLFNAVHKCCVHYCCLAATAAERGLKLFLVTPKFHFWLHIAYFARYCNPKYAWCYANEDFVGKIAQVAHAASFGLGPLKLGPSLVHRYLVAMALRIQRRSQCMSLAVHV